MGLNARVPVGGVRSGKLGREFDFFITAVKMIGVLCLHPLPPTPPNLAQTSIEFNFAS